jgi:alpha-1,2-mannosyltransferase
MSTSASVNYNISNFVSISWKCNTIWFNFLGIVECMAAGLVMIANKSGGPLLDIIIHRDSVQSRIGFLAADEEEYSVIMNQIIKMEPERRARIQQAAR